MPDGAIWNNFRPRQLPQMEKMIFQDLAPQRHLSPTHGALGRGKMKVKIFISWSGEKSRRVGEVFRAWLPSVLQYVQPYFTPEDVEKGAKWNSDISKNLEESRIGLICLTKENIDKPWIMFEAGALSKNLESSKILTLLCGIIATDVSGPLTHFQSTRLDKKDVKLMLETINNSAQDSKLDKAQLENTFEMCWPVLESKIKEALESTAEIQQERKERELLEETLEIVRNVQKTFELSRDSSELNQTLKQLLDENKSLNSEKVKILDELVEVLKQSNTTLINHQKLLSEHKLIIKLLVDIKKGDKAALEKLLSPPTINDLMCDLEKSEHVEVH